MGELGQAFQTQQTEQMEPGSPIAVLSAPKIREQHFSELAQRGGEGGKNKK